MTVDLGQLLLYEQDSIVQTVPITGDIVTIGRTPENALALNSPVVSRHHAELRVRPEGLVLTDLGSANGTFVDGARLLANQPRLLVGG
ncbi:MAG: FHA domain-containing protein, partial [Roseiflexaceae bacterium]|nr:FHA domain-containing protein [Roseiflexaceae bacterium]